jgi:hypothetical protein
MPVTDFKRNHVMNAQPLMPTPSPTALQFSDAAGCKRWIDQLPLNNVQEAQLTLAGQFAALRTATLPAIERLGMLEMLKGPVDFVQQESANRYSGKPLPLGAAEAAAWNSVVGLWEEVRGNYQICLQAYREGELEIAPHAALITMRCLECAGKAMLDYYRAYRKPPAALWRALHELYSFAEQHGYARIRVADEFAQRDPDSSCAEVYVQALLAHQANPYALSARQLGFVQRWIAKWATLVSLSAQPPAQGSVPVLAVDLTGGEGMVLAADAAPHAGMRYVDLEPLSKTLRQTITLLKQGQTPAQLGLGENARQPGCENLLMLLYVHWCRAGAGRMEERQQTQESATVCFGVAAAHLQLSGGREFRQPGELTSREKQDLDTFGYIMRSAQEAGGKLEDTQEKWQILNHSLSGFMCMLREPSERTRVGHNQLIAVRRGPGGQFQTGMVQWLRIEETGEMCCGVRLFPGVPQATAVRPSNFAPGNNRYERALLLPEVPASGTPATLILPPGWFQNGRFVEVFTDRKHTAKLINLLEMGNDFDRCTVTLI